MCRNKLIDKNLWQGKKEGKKEGRKEGKKEEKCLNFKREKKGW